MLTVVLLALQVCLQSLLSQHYHHPMNGLRQMFVGGESDKCLAPPLIVLLLFRFPQNSQPFRIVSREPMEFQMEKSIGLVIPVEETVCEKERVCV